MTLASGSRQPVCKWTSWYLNTDFCANFKCLNLEILVWAGLLGFPPLALIRLFPILWGVLKMRRSTALHWALIYSTGLPSVHGLFAIIWIAAQVSVFSECATGAIACLEAPAGALWSYIQFNKVKLPQNEKYHIYNALQAVWKPAQTPSRTCLHSRFIYPSAAAGKKSLLPFALWVLQAFCKV